LIVTPAPEGVDRTISVPDRAAPAGVAGRGAAAGADVVDRSVETRPLLVPRPAELSTGSTGEGAGSVAGAEASADGATGAAG